MLDPLAHRQKCSSLRLADGAGLVGPASNRSSTASPARRVTIVVSGLGLVLLLHGKTEAIAIKGLHGSQVSCHQSNVVKTFVGEHPVILSLKANGRKCFLAQESRIARTRLHALWDFAKKVRGSEMAAR